ncbi:MAG: spore cortex biosynthesis protein YabQ [Clostridium cadaveris]|nr:spore cortex biosynthesis protein YabQ [Clostridium cadaveris]MDU4953307.1 spore cortex biosynthesis protein YabQ [Clostridium sp.]MDM8312001.1 spore cortex biosynthesis protein YabQ [Clostridium cadaveris]MDY4949550.1 spore cortex biosynthesis protein YabQ [Clostridium cadaveris]NME65933.1 spore cortex biosynthesis protein YabQ [Clostridium cadaveris]NWK09949.1 spore cortex biosynthesis protein YabQ [Clostridium cadaveris]
MTLQVKIVIFSILAGVLTGIMFDLYRLYRGFTTSKIVMIIEDILFWILATIVVFIFLLNTNYAFVSAYVYISIGMGILLYLRLFSKILRKFYYKTFRSIYKGIRVIGKQISYPFKLLFYNRDYQKKDI